MPNTLTQEWLAKSVWKPDLFKGKVAYVTGGAGSICRVQTEALVLLGADAVIIGRNVDKTEKAAAEIATLRKGAKVIGIGAVDVRKIEDLTKSVERTVKELGRIDFVIAGAAGNFLSSFANLSSNAFKSVIDIDLIGSYNTAKATFEEIRKSKGHYLFISATLQYRSNPFQLHPSAAKSGVDSLSNSLAVELGPLGIRSNVIAPGLIGSTEGASRLVPTDMQERTVELIPLGFEGATSDIAEGTVFLFSNAGSYISGQTLVIDGAQWQMGPGSIDKYPQNVIEQNSGKNKL